MGTRNLTLVKHRGEYKIAQYGQWDGYPEGQGSTALHFLRNEMDREAFEQALDKCAFISSDEVIQLYKDIGVDLEASGGLVRVDDSRHFKEKHPQLDRDMGAEILAFVQNSGGAELTNQLEFGKDALFCEWSYLIDLDENTFSVHHEYPSEPIKSFSLDNLPSVEEFLTFFAEEDAA